MRMDAGSAESAFEPGPEPKWVLPCRAAKCDTGLHAQERTSPPVEVSARKEGVGADNREAPNALSQAELSRVGRAHSARVQRTPLARRLSFP